MSDLAAATGRGGPQVIPRPARWRTSETPSWSPVERISVASVVEAVRRRGDAPAVSVDEVPIVALPGPARRPAAVLCLLFEEGAQAHVVLTRRSSSLRSHTHQVSFPGGRLEEGERPEQAALREAREEVGIDPSEVEIVGRLSQLRTAINPSPILPFVGVALKRPVLVPNPAEVERAFTVPLVELTEPGVHREELWSFPDGSERPIHFFELVGDTVWGATARMLVELLELVIGFR